MRREIIFENSYKPWKSPYLMKLDIPTLTQDGSTVVKEDVLSSNLEK